MFVYFWLLKQKRAKLTRYNLYISIKELEEIKDVHNDNLTKKNLLKMLVFYAFFPILFYFCYFQHYFLYFTTNTNIKIVKYR